MTPVQVVPVQVVPVQVVNVQAVSRAGSQWSSSIAGMSLKFPIIRGFPAARGPYYTIKKPQIAQDAPAAAPIPHLVRNRTIHLSHSHSPPPAMPSPPH